jgi:hypothetical protein
MKRIVLVSLVVACARNADIGISNQPVTCQPGAAGAASGTITSAMTHQSYTFGSVQASLSTTQQFDVVLAGDMLSLQVIFPCGNALGTYEVGLAQTACPMFVSSSVSANPQQFFANGVTGTVILDQNVGCLAGRYEIDYGYRPNMGAAVDEGTIAGWFSVPH